MSQVIIKGGAGGVVQEQGVECGLDCMLRTFKWRRPRPDIKRRLEDDFHRTNSIFYSPIRPWQIRLLEIRPGSAGEPLQLDLHVATLVHEGAVIQSTDKCVSFAALSYSWGTSGQTTTIKVGTSTLRVLSVVQEALSPVQQALAVNSIKYVWIDAVCINQYDVVERSQQVRRMSRIFSMARLVIIWPGNYEQCGGSAVEYTQKYDARLIHAEECKRGLEEVVQGLVQLLGRPWFERTWIRQEIFAAARAELLVGTTLVPFWEFKRVLRLIIDQVNTQLSASSTDYMQRLLRYHAHLDMLQKPTIEDIVQLRGASSRTYLHDNDKWWLDTYLRGSSQFRATDPRDYVYGIVSMTSVTISDTPPQFYDEPPSLALSYRKTAREVFADTTVYLINFHQNLDIMYLTSTHGDSDDPDSMKSLPSWVPDWTSLPQITYLDYIWFVFRRIGSRSFMSSQFSVDMLNPQSIDWTRLNLPRRYRRPERAEWFQLAWNDGFPAGDSRTAATNPGNGSSERESRQYIQIQGTPFARVGHKVLKGEKISWMASKTTKESRQFMADWSVRADMKFVELEVDRKSDVFKQWQPIPYRKGGCWVPAASQPEDVVVFLPRATLPAVLRRRADILGMSGCDITEFYQLIGPAVSYDYIVEEAPLLDDHLSANTWMPNPWQRESSQTAMTFRRVLAQHPTQEFAVV